MPQQLETVYCPYCGFAAGVRLPRDRRIKSDGRPQDEDRIRCVSCARDADADKWFDRSADRPALA